MNMTEDKLQMWKVIRIYRMVATSRKGAIETLYVENPESYLTDEFAVEDRPRGWFGSLVKQLLG
jgi:hypothetical protein